MRNYYRAFRNALNDHDLERAIVQSTTESIDEALHLALRYEAYDMSNPFRSFLGSDYQTQGHY
jgi:hypothetical protein